MNINSKNVLDVTRELGSSIVDSKEYSGLLKAEEDFHNDSELSQMLGELERLRDQHSSKDKSDSSSDIDYLESYMNKINTLEQLVSTNTTMVNLKQAKEKYDKLFKNINNLISYMTDEESRVMITQSKCGCGGNSGGCSGCSKK